MHRILSFNHCLSGVLVFALLSLLPNGAGAQKTPEPRTFTYKTVGKLQIKADVYQRATTAKQPVVMWIHGGALIMGDRRGVNRRLLAELLDAQVTVISIDYRLAPETQLPEIIADVTDAYRWIHKRGPQLLGVDGNRIGVMGGSAGGYLTLVTGYRAKPRPRALVAFWGYGDLIGDWYSKPSPHPRHRKIVVSREEAFQQVKGPPISMAADRVGNGGIFYQFCRQTGEWPHAVSGWDPRQDARKFFEYMPVKNVTEDYSPTLLIHGTKDTDVPFEQSVMMQTQFKRANVPHQLITIAGGEHGLQGGDPEEIKAAYVTARTFMLNRLKSP